MPYTKVNNVNIYYEVHGEGEPVVLLNGIFMNTKSWFYQYTVLSRKYKVILHDLRGQWNSEKPKNEDAYSIEIHADDLKELLDKLRITNIHLVGTSYGGEIALQFAIKYPEYVKDLIVITAASEIHLDLKLSALRWMEGAKTKDPYKFILSWIND
ncbi:MAG TPA: alpha/beta hydrolase, partial [Desulfurococcaceae archaeon]|nr:alpha/beta hydrolase [Desulfurococcaceae archaeon]